MIQKIGFSLLVSLLLGSALWVDSVRHAIKSEPLLDKLNQTVNASSEQVVNCAQFADQKPIVILALGQSNAANHGEKANAADVPVLLIADNKCILAANPLPGSTGSGGSIWYRLPHYWLTLGRQRPLVLSVMGIDATSIADWTEDKSPLRQHLTDRVKSMKTLGLLPQFILWQQGEADARLGTTSEAYIAGLSKLAIALSQAGSDAPIVMAYSTVCHSAPNAGIRAAINSKVAQNSRFKIGPDTDTMIDMSSRFDGCHFSAKGLDHAAQLWAAVIAQLESNR